MHGSGTAVLVGCASFSSCMDDASSADHDVCRYVCTLFPSIQEEKNESDYYFPIIGCDFVASQFSSPPSSRTSFLTGVQFFFGSSTGSFVSAMFMDIIYDFPVPYKKLVQGWMMCIALGCAVTISYDLCENRTRRRQQQLQSQHDDPHVTTPTRLEMRNEATESCNRQTQKNELLEPLIE